MNMVRAALRGQIAVKERELRELKLKASAFLTMLSEKAPAWVDVTEIDEDAMLCVAKNLATTIKETRAAKEQLDKLEGFLNG
jgi:hypothetical protein